MSNPATRLLGHAKQGFMLIRKLKRYIPTPLWVILRRANTYRNRLLTWRAISRQILGVNAGDRAILSRSSQAAWRTSLKNLDLWQDPDLLADVRVEVPGVGNFDLRAHSDDLYHVLPAREAPILATIRKHLAAGDTFVDAGANIGFFTVLAGNLVGPSGKVIAIEMMPDTAQRLRAHIGLNELANVEVVERALSDREDQVVTASVPMGKFGQASIVSSTQTPNSRQVRVQTVTLDAILANASQRIALMKMDLEGAEESALRGALAILPRVDSLVFEQLGTDDSVGSLLEAAGFGLSQLDGNNWLATRAEPPT